MEVLLGEGEKIIVKSLNNFKGASAVLVCQSGDILNIIGAGRLQG